MKKAYIFDLDGTLINSLPTIAHYGNLALSSVGLATFEEERYKYFVGDGVDLLIHRMLDAQNADNKGNFTAVRGKYNELYEDDVLYKTNPYDGIIKLLQDLKSKGIKIAVLSNKPDNVAGVVVEKLFGKNFFNICYGQRIGVEKKPSPEGVFEICRLLEVDLGEAVFVGDTNVDIMTGKNAGMYTIGVSWGFRDEQELLEAGADIIVKSPAEILDKIK